MERGRRRPPILHPMMPHPQSLTSQPPQVPPPSPPASEKPQDPNRGNPGRYLLPAMTFSKPASTPPLPLTPDPLPIPDLLAIIESLKFHNIPDEFGDTMTIGEYMEDME